MSQARIAGAPISWGVCEVPGWGYQMEPDRVLAEMAGLGLTATEFGPDGFLPADPDERSRLLGRHGLAAVGGFLPLVLHDADADPVREVRAALPAFQATGADSLVLAAATGRAGYDARPDLDDARWKTLLANLDRIAELADAHGLTATLHPHAGTLVETEADVRRVLDGGAVPLCLDTGHLLVGGTDPVALAAEVPGRVAHVHLKDVDASLANGVRSGLTDYTAAVRDGLFRPLGAGDVDVASIVSTLHGAGYAGWYVLEQDVMLDAAPPPDGGPVDGVRQSLDHLRAVLGR